MACRAGGGVVGAALGANSTRLGDGWATANGGETEGQADGKVAEARASPSALPSTGKVQAERHVVTNKRHRLSPKEVLLNTCDTADSNHRLFARARSQGVTPNTVLRCSCWRTIVRSKRAIPCRFSELSRLRQLRALHGVLFSRVGTDSTEPFHANVCWAQCHP